jgi:hypothetical protein
VKWLFINYRSEDSYAAVLLDRELTSRFGAERVFRASRSLRPGEDFVADIFAAVRNSAALIAIIGPTWLSSSDPYGRRRIDDERDWVRHEILEAFRHNIPVLPILLVGATMPRPYQLPPDIGRLGLLQCLRLDARNIASDLMALMENLASLAPELTSQTSMQGNWSGCRWVIRPRSCGTRRVDLWCWAG